MTTHQARRAKVISLLMLFAFSAAASGKASRQQASSERVRSLEVGAPIESVLARGETHVYTMMLAAGDLIDGAVEPTDIAVGVSLLAPDGTTVFASDGAGRGIVRIPLFVVVDTGGLYRLVVLAAAGPPGPGRYTLRLSGTRPATEGDRILAEARSTTDRAEALQTAQRFQEAVPLAERALPLFERALAPGSRELALALGRVARILSSGGASAAAERLYLRSVDILEKLRQPVPTDLVLALMNLAVHHVENGDLERAEKVSLSALQVAERDLGPDHLETQFALSTLGRVYAERGELAKAELYFARVRTAIEKTHASEFLTALALMPLASVCASTGAYETAEAMFGRVLATMERQFGPDAPMAMGCLISLGDVCLKAGKPEHARAHLERALAIAEKQFGPESEAMAVILGLLARTYLADGDAARAEPLLVRARHLFAAQTDAEESQTYIDGLLGTAYRIAGEFHKAEPLLARSTAMKARTLGPYHPLLAEALCEESLVDRALGNIAKAVDEQAGANAIRERELALNLAAGSERRTRAHVAMYVDELDATVSLHTLSAPSDMHARRLALGIVLQRKGRVLDTQAGAFGAVRRRATPADRELLDALARARARLSTLAAREPTPETLEHARTMLTAAEREAELAEGRVAGRGAELRAQVAPVTIESVQAALPVDTALIEFASYRPVDPTASAKARRVAPARYVAFVLAADGEPRSVDLGDAYEIDNGVRTLRAALRDPSRRDVDDLSRTLDERIMHAVRTMLPAGVSRLVVAPDGELNLVAFGALKNEAGNFLVETYSISYVSSGRDLLRRENSSTEWSAPLVLANPAFGAPAGPSGGEPARARGVELAHARFRALPASELEARDVGRLLDGATTLTGTKATESTLKRATAPRVLHIATHGFFLGGAPMGEVDPVDSAALRSGIALAGANRRDGGDGEDGILTALEASGLDLWGTRLVVLSACDSGVGEVRAGDGVYGLRRALVLAGAETQVMSLWDVDDGATRELMVAYYKELLAGAGRADAMRRVQLRMLKDPRRRHPAYWASFIVSGDWRPLD